MANMTFYGQNVVNTTTMITTTSGIYGWTGSAGYAFDRNNNKYFSTNVTGTSWHSVSVVTMEKSFYCVACGQSAVVAIPNLLETTTLYAIVSTDHGLTWSTGGALSFSTSTAISSLEYGNGSFVAVANSGNYRVWRSNDNGATWLTTSALENNSWNKVKYGGGAFIAVSPNGTNRIMRSADNGATWTSTSYSANQYFFNVEFGNDLFIAVAYSGTAIKSNDYGLTWSVISSLPIAHYFDIAYGLSTWVLPYGVAAAGDSSTNILYSTDDGGSWNTSASYSGKFAHAISFGLNKFIAMNDTYSSISYDGIVWTDVMTSKVVSGSPYNHDRIDYDNLANRFIDVNAYLTSTSGIQYLDCSNAITFEVSSSDIDAVVFNNITSTGISAIELYSNTITSYIGAAIQPTGNYIFSADSTTTLTKIIIALYPSLNDTVSAFSFGNIAVVEKLHEFTDNPAAGDYKPKFDRTEYKHKMSDGGTATYVIQDNFSADVKLKYVSSTDRNDLKTIYQTQEPIVFIPFPTGTGWDGEIYEVNWVDDFDLGFTDNYTGNGYNIKMKLEETPK